MWRSDASARPQHAPTVALAAVLALLLAGGSLQARAQARELTSYDYRGAPKDLVLWGELAKVGVVRQSGSMQVTFLPPVLALDGKTVTLLGFMTAIEPGQESRRFLLSSQPLGCAHCRPPGAADIVEVSARETAWIGQTPVLVRGRLKLVKGATEGPIYRLEQAAPVPRQR